MRLLKKALSTWSKEAYGNIFEKIATLEDIARIKEEQMGVNPTESNKEELATKESLRRYYQIEEDYWKQKAGMQWFKERDRTTKFFHSYVKGRRRKLMISEIQTEQGDTICTTQKIGEEVVKVFKEKFIEDPREEDHSILEVIPKIITLEQNREMTRPPTEEEVKEVVFSLNKDSVCGPDGFSGEFFLNCWDIIKNDICKLVMEFFCGSEIPKYVSHTNVVLIPKKEKVNKFVDLRPISLSSFANKILSKVLHERMVPAGIISTNQSGFMKNRNIAENVLLA
ncbi:hypothetical protein RDI58_004106 [Solanum bulbocastanum]|uniref:Reverse transcriptase domain-containing protein n=1 Tax=Solanum bulbocastanum TaxID=147425 RepID=A0AAN8YKZ6_SOLBU